ncbi:MAG TPA: alanine dehydrogenase [Acholeplasma sp.]|nr:alanine dehydrogenase [Acholeplasma sp.]
MIIGCVKEIKPFEFRVGLTPGAVNDYTNNGHTVLMESNAGVGSGFSNEDYISFGATIIEDAKSVWEKSEMIVKVKEPLESEFKFFRKDLILYTYLHLAGNRPLYDALKDSGVTSIGYETMFENGRLVCLEPMSKVAGRLSIIEAAKYLETPFGGPGLLISGIPGTPRANIVVIGAGIVGRNAIKMAVGMNSNVTVIDINTQRLSELEDLYQNKINTLYSNEKNLIHALADADVVIGAVLIAGDKPPLILTDEILSGMKKGALIIDVSIDQGGISNHARVTYHDKPTYEVDGLTFYGVANMPGSVPKTSSIALSNATLRYGLIIADGLEDALKNNTIHTGLQTRNYKGVYPTLLKLFK